MSNLHNFLTPLLSLQIDTDSKLIQYMPVVGILLILMWFVMSTRKRMARKGQRITAREQLERLKQRTGMHGDLEKLMVEIEEMAKRMSAQLDAKSIKLEKLLDEADIQISRLEKMMNRAGQGLQDAKRVAGGSEAGTFAGDSQNNTYGQHIADFNAGLSATAATGLPNTDDKLTQSVYSLSDQGLSPVEIAGQLSEQVGKVELILALRNVS